MNISRKFISIMLACIFACFCTLNASALNRDEYLEGAINIIGMKIGENKVFTANSVKNLTDSNNDSVILKSGCTFVPYDFAKHIGAEFESDNSIAVIKMNDILAKFEKDSTEINFYDADNENIGNVNSAQPSFINNNKLYIPLRELTNAFGFFVYCEDDGMILLSSAPLNSDEIAPQIAVARLFLTGKTITKPIIHQIQTEPSTPTTPPKIISSVKTGVVNADVLNMRESPNGTLIKTLVKDEKVYILGSKNDSGATWYQIRTQGWCYGYVLGSYINNIKSETVDMSFGFSYYLIDVNTGIRITYKNNVSGVKYASSNSGIATVSSDGIVVGKRPGMVTITASYGSEKGTYTLAVCNTALNKNVPTMNISTAGTNFIAVCEGGMSADGRFHKYKDVAGYWTIGYGHLIQDGETFPESISAEEAEALLHKDLNEGPYVKAVNNFAKREGLTLNQSQFDALVSFGFNLGAGYFGNGIDMYYLKATILSSRVGSGANPNDIYEGFRRYHYAGGKKYVGLYTRRMDEAEMFIKGDYKREGTSKWPVPDDGGKWN